MNTSPIKIYIVDDHPLVRTGLQGLIEIEEDMSVVGWGANVADSVNGILALTPDIVLLDVRLQNDELGFEIVRELNKYKLKTQFIVLTSVVKPEWVKTSFSEGIASYLVKELANDELVAAIRTVHAGGTVIDPNATKALVDHMKANNGTSPVDRLKTLSRQEMRIVKLIAEGFTNREIASRMSLSEKTIKNYFSNSLEKLKLSRRAEAAAFYARNAEKLNES